MAKPSRPLQTPSAIQAGGQEDKGPLVTRHEQVSIFSHSGPLPPPEVIAGYERALPGSADRIIRMAEREQEHRHRKNERELILRGRATFLGQVFGFLIGISGTLGGVFLVFHDKSIGGFSVFFVSLATLAGIYVYGKREQAKNSAQKKPSQPETSA